MVKVKLGIWETNKPGTYECEEIQRIGKMYVRRSALPPLFVDLPYIMHIDGNRVEVFEVFNMPDSLCRLV